VLTVRVDGGTVVDMDNEEREQIGAARGLVLGVCLSIVLWAVIGIVVVAVWRWTR